MTDKEKSIHPRKIEIVHAAVTCFLERGYHQTGVRDIAKQAEVSLGNLYIHFKGKEALLDALRLKPERHHFANDEQVQVVRFMSMTGG